MRRDIRSPASGRCRIPTKTTLRPTPTGLGNLADGADALTLRPHRPSCRSLARRRAVERPSPMRKVTTMINALREIEVADDDPVAVEQIPLALTAGNFVYDDGSTQVFEADGATTFVEQGRETRGRWHVDDKGHFCSFWPPSYRACYDLRWIVDGGKIVGLRFTGLQSGESFAGRYR